ncbi:MAG: DUF169 domain-containing protein [Thermodesulfobacteriota bacterium]
MDKKIDLLIEALDRHCRLATTPVAVKLAKKDDTPMEKTRYPVLHIGHRLAVCQGMSLARTLGWTMGFRKEDHACPMPGVFMGHISPDKFLEGAAAGFYQDEPEYMQVMEASYARWPMGSYQEIWLTPANRCEFVPDIVVVYGYPAQILALIQAANFRVGSGIKSMSSGRYGCSNWIAGVHQTGECTYMIPGPGERIFAGTQDSEVSFAMPYAKIDGVVAGLKFISSKGAYRYPVPNFGMLSEPKIPAKYFDIES